MAILAHPASNVRRLSQFSKKTPHTLRCLLRLRKEHVVRDDCATMFWVTHSATKVESSTRLNRRIACLLDATQGTSMLSAFTFSATSALLAAAQHELRSARETRCSSRVATRRTLTPRATPRAAPVMKVRRTPPRPQTLCVHSRYQYEHESHR